MTPEAAAELMQTMLFEYFSSTGCPVVEPPFWDDEAAQDADGDENDIASDPAYPWYEQLSDWIISGFIATTFSPAAAVVYDTTIPRLRLALRKSDAGAIVRVLVDGVEAAEVDTYSPTPDLATVDLDMTSFGGAGGFSAQSGARRLRIEHTGTANAAAVPVPGRGYRLDLIRKRLNEGELVDGRTPELRTVLDPAGDIVQWKYTDESSGAWRDLATLTDGAQGPQGPQGPEGPPGSRSAEPDPPVSGSAPRENRCGSAIRIRDRLFQVMTFAINQVNLGVSLGQFVTEILDNFDGIERVSWLPELFTNLTSVAVATVEAQLSDPQVSDDIQCWLFCNLPADNAAIGADFIQAWLNWTGDSGEIPAPLSLVMPWAIRSFGLQAWQGQQYIGSLSPSVECEALCTDCPPDPGEWCIEWDFTQSNHGFGDGNGRMTYAAGVGWVRATNNPNTSVFISKQFANSQIMRSEMYYAGGIGGNNRALLRTDGGATIHDGTSTVSPYRVDFDPAIATGVGMWFGADAEIGATNITITKVRIYGTGDPPAGEPVCPI